jgi:hypothetical protein
MGLSAQSCFAAVARRTGPAVVVVLILSGFFTTVSWAQQTDEQDGINEGNYNIKQSVEFGYRLTHVTGSAQTYDTMVNLRDGPRLLDFTTEMQSLDQHGTFFDRFYFSNFGYGGDPEAVSVLRVSKNKWYSFEATYRHYENFWDYSLLANPFNPPTPVANAPANFNPIVNAPRSVQGTPLIAISPQLFNTRRNLQNYALTLFPNSKIRFRLGYYLNWDDGPAFGTIHEGTEQFLSENLYTSLSQFHLGVDFRLLPKTSISYDEIWSYYKDDPGATDENQQFSPGPGLAPVDLGVTWISPPCNPAFQPSGLVTPTCNALYNYTTGRRTRLDFPTEQVSFQSSYFPQLQLSGKFAYTSGDMNVYNYSQSYAGFVGRDSLSNYMDSGPIHGQHVTSYADFGANWKITPTVSIVDEFHYGNWQEPGQYTSTQCSFFSPNLIVAPNFFTPTATVPASCTPPSNAVPGQPMHIAGSPADILVNFENNYLKQQITSNLIEAQIQLTHDVGAYVGYRFEHRVIADNFFNTENEIYFPNMAERGSCAPTGTTPPLPAGCTPNGDGSVSFETPTPTPVPPGVTRINYNSAVMGVWYNPSPKLRINFDADITAADTTFTRLGSQNAQQFRVRLQYKPEPWLNLTGYFLTADGQNPVTTINGSQHSRNAGVSIFLTRSEKFSAQLGYNYNNILSQLFICFTSSFAEPGLPACPGVSGLFQQFSAYSSQVNTGFIDLQWTPFRRLTLDLGANISTATGSQLNLNPLSTPPTAPTGALNSDWYEPFGSISYHFTKGWTGRASWNYYGYHEDSNGSFQDLYVPRNFQGNIETLAIRYSF